MVPCCVCSPDLIAGNPGIDESTICESCYSKTYALMDGFPDKVPNNPTSCMMHQVLMVGFPDNPLNPTSAKRKLSPCVLRLIKRLSDVVDFLRQKYPTDIQLLPGPEKGGFPIPAHTKFLAARSNVFKNMLDEDGVMEASGNGTIVFPELSHEELTCFSEFLYKGELRKPELDKHFKALFIAAHKYDVPSLAEALLKQLDFQKALYILEVSVSHTYSIERPKQIALKFIVQDMEKIVFTPEYADFATKNPNLSLEILRADYTRKRKGYMCNCVDWNPQH